MINQYDKEYFEDGQITGKSCYLNYHWMPELTIKMAHSIIKYIDIKDGETVLDFGCAKGFLVRALRILGVDAYGCDISDYAISSIDSETKPYCKIIEGDNMIPFEKNFDWIITKDVLEHINEEGVDKFLEEVYKKSDKMFHVIPLADNNDKFIIPEYEFDKTHILKKSSDWWINKFKSHGWTNILFSYSVKGIKDNWVSKYEKGNGFFVVKKN